MAKIICITGIDGAGKDTLLELLSENLKSVTIVDIWDILDQTNENQLFKSKKDIDDYLCSLSPDSRLLFLAHALKFSIDKALLSTNKYILLNAYYYKYFATELSLGASPELVKQLSKQFPDPDITFYLDVDVSITAERKKRFSRYECGLVENPNKSSFINAQTKAKEEWSLFDSSKMITIDASKSPEQIFVEVLNLIEG